MNTVLPALLLIAIQLMAPLVWAISGEIVSERSGVINVGLEGAILLGAWGTAIGYSHSGSPAIAIGSGVLVGVVTGGTLAALYVWRGIDQVVGGLMINLLAVGLTASTWSTFRGAQKVENLPALPIPVLSEIPVVGPAFFDQNALVYAALVFPFALYFALKRTRWGVRLCAAGEAPDALDSAGVSVPAVRSVGLIVGTTIAAVGGATLVLTSATGTFVPGMTAGIGYVALGLVLVSRWNPLIALAAAGGFGLVTALQYQGQSIPLLASIPTEVLLATPYVAAIVVVAFARSARPPAATGIYWSRSA